ncbi:MAG: hypothetical protein QOI07_2619 [Verrucomicrobiota bacterium]|jgi:hypothetical protein
MNAGTLLLILMLLVTCTTRGDQRDPIYRETAVRQARPRALGEKFDPQENDPQLRDVFTVCDAEAERAVGNVPRDQRFIFRFWSAKKKILRQKHGIDWKTPAELNPNIAYDSYGQPRITAREIREITPIVQKRLHSRDEKIANFERTFEGDINVWTKIGKTDGRGNYAVRRENSTWKVVDYHLVVP